MLAAILSTAAFTACSDSTAWIGDEADDKDKDDASKSESFEQYEDLSPEEVYEALLEAKDYVLTTTMTRTYESESSSATYQMEKDGDLIQATQSYQSDSGSESETRYFDLDNKISYVQEDGKWVISDTESSELMSLETLIERMVQGEAELMFEDDNYHPYDKTAGYLATNDAIEEAMGDATDEYAFTLSMTPNDTVYTYLFSAIGDEATTVMKFEVTFQSVSVTLPEVQSADNDSAVTDNNSEQTQNPDNKPSQPIIEYPSTDLYNRLLATENVITTLTCKLNGHVYSEYNLIKDGNLIKQYSFGEDAYFDLTERYVYSYSDGTWKRESIGDVFTWEFFLVEAGLAQDWWGFRYELFDAYSAEAGGQPLSEAAASTYRVTDALYQYDAATNTYLFTYTMSPYDFTISICFTNTSVVLPNVG